MADTPTSTHSSSSETQLWQGCSSQWIHFGFYALCVLLAAGIGVLAYYTPLGLLGLIIPAGMWIWRWWLTKTTVYTLTNERLLVTRGIITRHQDNLELYRVRDYCLKQPIMLRMFGLGNLELLTSDTMTPSVEIPAIKDVEDVREKLRSCVEAARDRKRVRQMDVDSVDNDMPDGMGSHS